MERIEMKLPEIIAYAFYITIALFSITYSIKATNKPQLPCGVAEISPDVTPEERKQCRQMRGHKL